MKQVLAAAAVALAVSGYATAAVPGCHATEDLLYCQDPGAVVRVAPFWMWSMAPGAGGTGGTPENKRAIYSNACSVMPAGKHLHVVNERAFRGRDRTYQLALVAFDEPSAHMEDRYAPDGEYQGQTKVTYTRGWTFRKPLTCDQ